MKLTESRSHAGHRSQHVQYDAKREKKVATALWIPVGSFCLLAALALVAAMTSEKVGPSLLSFIGQNPFAITLFGIPTLSGGLVALLLIGGAYARAAQDALHWNARIPPIVDDVSRSSLGFRVSIVVFIGFVVVPLIALGMANVKFFEGTVYYSADAGKGCEDKQSCENLGSGWNHFHAVHGFSLTNTHYRYEGNKTYIPIVYPTLMLAFSVLTLALSIRYFLLTFVN
jgi:hypothetical protein